MIFVTGGTGLVGSHVLLLLVKQKKEVKALKRKSSSKKLCKKIFDYYELGDLFNKIAWVEGDVNDISSLNDGISGCNFLIHCAGHVSFYKSEFENLKKINIEGTSNVVNAALKQGVKKLAYVSSIATLGSTDDTSLIDEECHFKEIKNQSNYAQTKYLAELEVWRASAEGLDMVIINPSVILGPGDWSKGSSQIFEKIYNGLRFYTSGSTGYVDVMDVADAIVKLLFSKIKNDRFIVNGANLTYRDCFDRIAISLGKRKATIKVTPFLKEFAWRFEAVKSLITGKKPLLTRETANSAMTNKSFSSSKIEQKFGFKHRDIDETIEKYSKWFIADQT